MEQTGSPEPAARNGRLRLVQGVGDLSHLALAVDESGDPLYLVGLKQVKLDDAEHSECADREQQEQVTTWDARHHEHDEQDDRHHDRRSEVRLLGHEQDRKRRQRKDLHEVGEVDPFRSSRAVCGDHDDQAERRERRRLYLDRSELEPSGGTERGAADHEHRQKPEDHDDIDDGACVLEPVVVEHRNDPHHDGTDDDVSGLTLQIERRVAPDEGDVVAGRRVDHEDPESRDEQRADRLHVVEPQSQLGPRDRTVPTGGRPVFREDGHLALRPTGYR